MAELADALDLGSSGDPVQVQVLLSAPITNTPVTIRVMGVFHFHKEI